MTQSEFVQRYWPLAVKVTQGTKILPGTVITAAGVESGWGNSKLASQYNNFFGFTADNSPNVPRVYMCNSQGQDCHYYKTYNSAEDSFRDYIRLLTSYQRYAPVLQADTVQEQFAALQAAGYATNPQYSSILSRAWSEIASLLLSGGKTNVWTVVFIAGTALVIWGIVSNH